MMFSIIDDMDKRERDYSIDFVKGVAILLCDIVAQYAK